MSINSNSINSESVEALQRENEVLRSALQGMLSTFGGHSVQNGLARNEIRTARVALGLPVMPKK